MTKSQEQLEIDNCELNHVLLTQQTFVSSKSREEKAYFEQAIQPKLIANLLAKKGAPFLISIGGQRRNIDVVVDGDESGTLGVVPHEYRSDPMLFVSEQLCKPILASSLKFNKLTIRWSSLQLPDLRVPP